MPPQPRSSDSNISYERAATLQDLKEMAMLDEAAQIPSSDLPRIVRSFAQPTQKRGVGFGFESLQAEMQAYKLEIEEERKIQERSTMYEDNNKGRDKFVVFKDEYEQSPVPRSLPSAPFPLSILSTPQLSESSPAPSVTHTASLPIPAAVLSQISLISRERADILVRLQALHEKEQYLLQAHVDALSFTSPSTVEAQSYTRASVTTIPSPSNLSPQPYTKPFTITTPSIRARATRQAFSTIPGPILNEDKISKPNMSSTTPRLPSHSTPSHIFSSKAPSSYQRATHTSAKHMSVRKDTTKQRSASKASSKPRTPLSTVTTPHKKNMASKLRTSKVEPLEKHHSISAAPVEHKQWNTQVVKDVFRDADASTPVDVQSTLTLEKSARQQKKAQRTTTPPNGKVDKRGVTKGRTLTIPLPKTVGEKGKVKATPGTSKVGELEGVIKGRTSGIPTSTRKPVSKGVKTLGKEGVATEWNVPATVSRKKWDF